MNESLAKRGKRGPRASRKCEEALHLLRDRPDLRPADIAKRLEVSDQMILVWAKKYGFYESPFERRLRFFMKENPGVSGLGKIAPEFNDNDYEPIEEVFAQTQTIPEHALAVMGAN